MGLPGSQGWSCAIYSWDTKATQKAGPDGGQWVQAGLFLDSGALTGLSLALAGPGC